MTCSGSRSGTCTANDGYCFYTCTPGDAAFFTFGQVDEAKCHANPASRRDPAKETFMDIDVPPTRVSLRQPDGTFVQNTGFGLPKSHCIVSCDRLELNYDVCVSSDAAGAWLSPQRSEVMALGGAVLLWLA
jgi:hypothetical protein